MEPIARASMILLFVMIMPTPDELARARVTLTSLNLEHLVEGGLVT